MILKYIIHRNKLINNIYIHIQKKKSIVPKLLNNNNVHLLRNKHIQKKC